MKKYTEKHPVSQYETPTVIVNKTLSQDIITASGGDENWGSEWDGRKEKKKKWVEEIL